MKRSIWGIVVLALLAVPSGPAGACSTFCIRDDGRPVVFGKNYDWDIGNGYLIVNRRGVERTALVSEGETPARWTR